MRRDTSVRPWAIWVLAVEPNGHSRFHLLLRWSPGSGGDTWFDVRDDVAKTWAAVTGGGSARIELRVTDDRLARHVTKAGPTRTAPPTSSGRWWGILGRDAYAATSSRPSERTDQRQLFWPAHCLT